jgi:endonuclease III
MLDLRDAVALLETHYGKPKPSIARTPFEMLLHEKAGYLVPDEKRDLAFRELKKHVGTTPRKILDAPMQVLQRIAGLGGIYAETRAFRMKQCAELALQEDLASVLRLEFKKARKALTKYPMIGEPGAEKILLFAHAHPVLALESNGLRVVVRLGFGEDHKNYATMYRRTQQSLNISGWTCDRLIVAHQLLRRHGQEICRRVDPGCSVCPLQAQCVHAHSLE